MRTGAPGDGGTGWLPVTRHWIPAARERRQGSAQSPEVLIFPPRASTGDRLDARDHLVDCLVHGHLFADDAIHRLRPYVLVIDEDRKSTRLNSSHLVISYAV